MATEPPETPAPIFAVRALKSAIFGSPKSDDDEVHTMPTQASKIPTLRRDFTAPAPAPSPTKSILLTPGTVVARRKTVTFGETRRNLDKGIEDLMTAPTPRPPGGFPSPWSTKKESPSKQSSARRTNKFTQSLLDARSDRTSSTISLSPRQDSPPTTKISKETRSTQEVKAIGAGDSLPRSQKLEPLKKDNGVSGAAATLSEPIHIVRDETLNLDEPRSKSGQYWKKEFDEYQSRSSREIKSLLKYRHVAKSKDAEVTKLTDRLSLTKDDNQELRQLKEKLREAERKVSRLEEENASLKGTLSRVKKEMKNYDSRRRVKEEKMKSQISKLKGQVRELSRRLFEERDRASFPLRISVEEKHDYTKEGLEHEIAD